MADLFTDRMERWRRRFMFDFRKSWWWVLLVGPVCGFLWLLVMDRVISATNRYIDQHVSLASIRPAVLSLWGSPFIHPIMVGFAIFLAAILSLLGHAYIETRPKKRDHRGHEGQKQKETREKAVAEQLPEHRPRVIPSEYGRNPERGSYGLYIVNPGYMALEVHIPTAAVASSGYMLVFPAKLTQFGERDHKRFMEAWLEHSTLPGRDGCELFNVMRAADTDSFALAICYKDLDSVWYKSNCRIERDVQSGLRVIFLGQELLGPEKLHESPSPAESTHPIKPPEEAPQRKTRNFDWHSEWTRLEKSFRRLDNDHVYAENGRDRLGVEFWLLGSDGTGKETIDECKALCELAGSTLIASIPKIPLSETTSSQSEHWIRWLSHVRDVQGYTWPTRYSYSKGISYEGGKIDNPARQSALACMKCRATTYG